MNQEEKFLEEPMAKDIVSTLKDADKWHSVEDRPLFTKDEIGNWVTTEDGDHDFIAAIETNKGWWIRHCVVEDEVGLCVVGDDYNQPAGWELEDVTHWMPMPEAPIKMNSMEDQDLTGDYDIVSKPKFESKKIIVKDMTNKAREFDINTVEGAKRYLESEGVDVEKYVKRGLKELSKQTGKNNEV